MPDCSLVTGCPFFNDRMKGLEAVKNMLKKKYCHGDFDNCARYMVFKKLGRSAVPADLAPNQQARAKQLL
ncbi:MAG: hypothetical protein K8R90_06705 [Candidatus Cloacimonetes bacterium]|nr:hypothetical protein [Candidatus Cloacimonadota bacterium]